MQERSSWGGQIEPVKRIRERVLEAEHILDGSWAKAGEQLRNAKVGRRFDRWRKRVARRLTDGTVSTVEHDCLERFLQVLSNLRPRLIQCDDLQAFPRTNNETERGIGGLKTRYRRISGRKNWNSYLLRYGRCVAYYDWWDQDTDRRRQLEEHLKCVDPIRWRQERQETKKAQSEQLKRFRFRHKPKTYLCSLETRWAAATQT